VVSPILAFALPYAAYRGTVTRCSTGRWRDGAAPRMKVVKIFT
jgi:hypothetical protein